MFRNESNQTGNTGRVKQQKLRTILWYYVPHTNNCSLKRSVETTHLMLCMVDWGVLPLFCPIYFIVHIICVLFFVYSLGVIDIYITHI